MIKSFGYGFKEGIKLFGECVSTLINSLLLFFVYLIGVGLTSICARIVGKKFLDREIDERESYWNELDIRRKSVAEHLRQF